MKHTLILLPLLAITATATAQTPARPAGGYTGPGIAASTVAAAKDAPDDTRVRLRGKLSQHLGGDRYVFRDASGSLHVDIDADLWQGQSIGADDLVELDGEIDKDWTSLELDVDRIRKL